jgi:uncharacterized protein YraI
MSLKLFRHIGIAGILFLAMITLMNPLKTEAADSMWTARYWNNPTLNGDPVLERAEAEINYDWGDGSPASGLVNSDNFSVYWKRSINFSAGTYRFTATMDDGMRVWVDGVLIIDSWWDSQVHSMSHDLYLNSGDHNVEVRYYDVGAKAVAKLSWTAVGGGSVPGPIVNWRGEYFNNKNLTGTPVLVRDDPQIDFDWGVGSPAWNVVSSDQFSARWTRTASFQPGRYRFTVVADDGVRLWINGQLVLDKWLDSLEGTYFVEVDLSGSVSMQMEYYENIGGAVARLSWLPLTGGGSSTWSGQYFNNKNLSGSPVLTRNDSSINFDWGSGSPAAGVVSADNFSVRWSRNLSITAGRYRFTVAVDDGARLWVNNELIINQWKDQPLTTYSAEIDLPTGSIPVRMEYYDATGGAHAHLSWTTVGVTINNWRGEYYNNTSLSGGPAVIRDDASVDFNWGNNGPVAGVSSDNFSARWTRTIVLPAGRYRFTTRTDDGTRLWVNNQLIIDRWYTHSVQTAEAEIELYGGPISIKMEYFDGTGLAEAHLSWTQLTNPPTGGGSGQGGVGTATVASTLLNVRQGPAVTYPIITTLSRGTVVQLGGYRNATTTWVMLILPSGQQGWSYAPFLQTSYNLASLPVWSPPDSGGTPSGATATVVNAYHLNVRSGPGVSFTPIMTLPRGTVVQLVGRNSSSTWLKIRMPSGTQGWSNAYYLQTTYTISSLPVLTN